jgi:Cu2+-exporting ATPase
VAAPSHDAEGCALCGLPLPPDPPAEGPRRYCCAGCLAVARLLDDAGGAHDAARAAAAPPGAREAFLWVDGMHCASCAQLLELTARRVPGVHAVQVSYATSTARIVHDPARIAQEALPEALSAPGYRWRLRGRRAAEDDERPRLLRLLTGGVLASAVMMLSFLFLYPIHAGLAQPQDYDAIRWLAFGVTPLALFVLCSVLVFYVGWPILRGAATGIRVGALNMDSLLALSILSAYAYSVGALWFDPIDLYFDVAGSVVAIVTIGRFLEQGARERATQALARIMDAPPPTARIVRDGQSLTCAADELCPGDRVFVRAGETVPVDGRIVGGEAAIDESLLTGEPFPAARARGDHVLGGAVLRDGEIEIEVGAVVGSRIASLARMLWQAQSAAGGVPGRVDRIARVFVPAVLVLALLVGAGTLLAGASAQQALLASLATLIVSCPCTFGLAVPLTTASAVAAALERGMLVTRADLFERATRIDLIAVDKTGTLSSGEMVVADVVGPPETAALAAAVERDSPHPVARAIARLDDSRRAREPRWHPGRGASGWVGQRRVAVGSAALFDALGWPVPAALAAHAAAHDDGDSVASYVGWDGAAHGAIVTRDRPRPGWEAIVGQLRAHAPVVLLTGAQRADAYAGQVDEVFAGVPPEAKAEVVRRMQTRGRIAMIGDGSNDAPALAQADLGIAFGAPTALAAQAADIVIASDRLERVLDAFALLATTQRRIRQNLGWALSYNAIAIPLAMAGAITPLWAALAMVVSSALVVANATRPLLPPRAPGDTPAPQPQPARAA